MKGSQKILFFILAAISAIPIFAAEPQALSLEDCLRIGEEASKQLKVSQAKISYADAKVSESVSSQYPSLKLSGGYTRLSEVDPFKMNFMGKDITISPSILNNYSAKLTLAQPIFAGNRLTGMEEMNQYSLQAAGQDLLTDKLDLRYNIKTAYWSLFKAKRMLEIFDENIKQVKAHLTDVENMEKAGMAQTNDVMKVRVQLANLEFSKIETETMYRIAQSSLNNLLGRNLDQEIQISDKPQEAPDANISVGNYIETAISGRSELKATEYRIKSGEAGLSIAKAAYYPSVNFVANYTYANPNQRINPPEEKFKGTWDVGINFSFDLWNWNTAEHQTAQAKASLDQANWQFRAAQDLISLDVTQSALNRSKSIEKLNAAKITVEQATENHRVTLMRFKNGAAINSDLIDAEFSLLQSKINYTSALADVQIATAKLERSIGK